MVELCRWYEQRWLEAVHRCESPVPLDVRADVQAIDHTDKLLKQTDVTLDQMIVNPNPSTVPARTNTPRRGGQFGRRGGGGDGSRGGGGSRGGRGGGPFSPGPGHGGARDQGPKMPATSPFSSRRGQGQAQNVVPELISLI
jgi:hypothetical protein